MKTGSEGRPWVELDRPKPPRVADRYEFWTNPPPELSPACQYWVRQIGRGWLPNRRIGRYSYDTSASWFGVWIWEYWHVLTPMIEAARKGASARYDSSSAPDEHSRIS